MKFLADFPISRLSLPIAVVYEKPSDYPNDFVVRIFDQEKPTPYFIIRSTLDECREDIRVAGFYTKFPRSKNDDPVIVESWL